MLIKSWRNYIQPSVDLFKYRALLGMGESAAASFPLCYSSSLAVGSLCQMMLPGKSWGLCSGHRREREYQHYFLNTLTAGDIRD